MSRGSREGSQRALKILVCPVNLGGPGTMSRGPVSLRGPWELGVLAGPGKCRGGGEFSGGAEKYLGELWGVAYLRDLYRAGVPIR